MKKHCILEIISTRVRRNYTGGIILDELEGKPNPVDGDRPEDWLASTTEARNPGLCFEAGEGLTKVVDEEGESFILRDLFREEPEHYLGARHCSKLGTELGFLAKLLDSSMRLHVQAHPTAKFAQAHLNSRWGKLETYVILGHRKGCEPYIRLGFQSAPSPAEWKRIVLEQDIRAMDACFEKIPVSEGEVWMVPGGLPHAIGEGLLVMEVMEPSDLVVRCEFERNGITVPEEARFMGRAADFALQIFDHTPMSTGKVREKCMISPQIVLEDKNVVQELLIGPGQTDCFNEYRIKVSGNAILPLNGKVNIGMVARGSGLLNVSEEKLGIRKGSRFLLSATADKLSIIPEVNDSEIEIILCSPG